MNAEAQAAIEWTRGRLSDRSAAFSPNCRSAAEDDRLYVHSEASNPPRWRYVQDASDAGRSMMATDGANLHSAATSTAPRSIRCR